jgi:hypothetical protein
MYTIINVFTIHVSFMNRDVIYKIRGEEIRSLTTARIEAILTTVPCLSSMEVHTYIYVHMNIYILMHMYIYMFLYTYMYFYIYLFA